MKIRTTIAVALLLLYLSSFKPYWGFYAHQKVNRLAVYTLPPELIGFYKKNIEYLTENAVNPDKRRYIVKDEAPRHYIDLDVYPDSVKKLLPGLNWQEAVTRFTADTLLAYGIVPWQIQKMKFQLTEAFVKRDAREILRLSADLGHYIGDANVPLHTTQNYNGQLSGQTGIHGFWESRLPELFAENYDCFTGPASYIQHPAKSAWQAVLNAHTALDSVLAFEKELSKIMDEDKKFTIEERNGITIRAYSLQFSTRYHAMLRDQVARQLKASVKMTGDFWYTCWVDAGQPDLSGLGKYLPDAKEKEEEQSMLKSWLQNILNVRKEADY